MNKSSKFQSSTFKPKIPKELFGDRKSIVGNFTGGRIIDTLKESVISSLSGKEINKYYDEIGYDSIVALTVLKKPICRLQSSRLKPLTIETKTWQLFGIAYLRNEGDLDGNGTDEIGLVVDWADWSNVNSYRVYTYSKNAWKMMLTFEIRDYDIDEIKDNKDSKGFMYKDSSGNLIARTYNLGEKVERRMKLNKE